jgi:5,10-methylenetetrahydrofolate reductase
MSKLSEALARGEFAVTSEVGPPKGTRVDELMAKAALLSRWTHAVNVTEQQHSCMKLSSLAACALLAQRGVEPIVHAVCRDRNRVALQSDLLAAWTLGVRNVLVLTGDHPRMGDHPEALPVFDLDSVQLLLAVQTLNRGQDLAGNALDGAPDFFAGAVVNPTSDALELQILKMKKKIAAGARFFQTQAVFAPERLEAFMERAAPLRVPVLAGLVLPKSPTLARFMKEKVPGMYVPDELIAELAAVPKADRRKKAVEVAARIIRRIRPVCQGVHIMALGWEDLLPDILAEAGLREKPWEDPDNPHIPE